MYCVCTSIYILQILQSPYHLVPISLQPFISATPVTGAWRLCGGLWFEELVSGHDLHGGRVASWLGQPPVHGGPLSSRASDSFVLVWVGKSDGLVALCNGFVLAGPDVPALVSITDFLLVWPGLFHVLGLSSYPFQGCYARSWFKSASQWFRPSVFLLQGGGHSSVGRWLSLGCEGPRVRIGGLGRRFPESGGVLGVHSPLCSSVVLLELLSFSSFGDVQMA
ncbi:hypothetical protein Bca52824_086281 [Brassica carinata]|uniref:Uncharacterized protein n=1 Tax=Brassica carinata TaxID=52824 RepID=A0A8X7P9X5_BRACI|nr:hypothetical protein Bca52824_086281 [Brassica carinata]